jgi:hypothetical protein
MIWEPGHGNSSSEKSKPLDPGALNEIVQGQKIARTSETPYSEETALIALEAKDQLQDIGRKLLGHAHELQDHCTMLAGLAAALEVGAYDRISKSLQLETANTHESLGVDDSCSFTRSLPGVADMLQQLLSDCDNLTGFARIYAEGTLELSDSVCADKLSLAMDKAHDYIAQNQSRPIREVEEHIRWVVEHFDDIMEKLNRCLDGIVELLEEVKSDEPDYGIQLQRCQPEPDAPTTTKLLAADRSAREILLQNTRALQSRLRDDQPDSFNGPINELRAALLAEAQG